MKAILCLMLLSLTAGAAEKIDLKPKTDSKKGNDPGSATQLLYEAPKKVEEKAGSKGIAVTTTCTDHLGMVHKKGDKSFESCLRNLDATTPPTSPNDKRRPSFGITIGD